jgi:hypothetical protein
MQNVCCSLFKQTHIDVFIEIVQRNVDVFSVLAKFDDPAPAVGDLEVQHQV